VNLEEEHRPFRIDILTVGMMQTACYIVVDKATDEMMVVDPGGDPEVIAESVGMAGSDPKCIVNTHGHADHLAANARLKELYPEAELCVHPADAPMLADPEKNLSGLLALPIASPPPDRMLEEGDALTLGASAFRVLHLPGHTPGGIGLYWAGTDCVAGMVFCGDTLFAGGIGRPDLPGGDERTLLRSIREKLLVLPDDTLVLPGHGPATTVGREKTMNPFVGSSARNGTEQADTD